MNKTMPLYEYECSSCGHRIEVIQRIADPPLESCTECSGPVRRLISAPAFQFKGTGWYVTDYAKKGGTSSESSKSSGEESSAKSSSESSSKPEKSSKSVKSGTKKDSS